MEMLHKTPRAPARTIVIGAGGSVGAATLEAILMRNASADHCIDLYAGVRDAQNFEKYKLGIPIVITDMSRRLELTKNLKGFERAFIVVPCDMNRTGLASIALDACKAAGVKFVLILSVTVADTNTRFGRQFKPIEDRTKSLGLDYTIIRVPIFMENLFAHADTIKKQDMICDPRDPRHQFASLSLCDLGRCAAEILLYPTPHHQKTYNLVSQTFSMIDLSQSISRLLKRNVKVREIQWDQFRYALFASQIPEWQIDGLMEWLDSDYDERFITQKDLDNVVQISGNKPTTLEFFLAVHAPRFGWRV